MKKIIITLASIMFINASIFSSTFFSGYAGGKFGYTSNHATNLDGNDIIDPDLKLQAFFAGQFNFSQNAWGRMEFSIDTEDFISQSLFSSTQSEFQVDEVSVTIRNQNLNLSNYFSSYMGTYDAIGSDIFLQRYFSMEGIASKLTDSWLGMNGSILYPHFGIGVSDVIRLYNQPIAYGGYVYFNHEDKKYFVLNSDLRFACNYRYFTCDFATGLGAPLSNKYKGEAVILAIDKLYWHCGTTLLLGNNYTQSLFAQAGIFNAVFKGKKNPDDVYLLIEPRFIFTNNHVNITFFSLPSDTVSKILYIDDTLGFNVNFYSEALTFNGTPFTLGCHTTLSFENQNFLHLKEFKTFFAGDTKCFNINIMPYISTKFLSGEVNGLLKVSCMDLANYWYEAFSFDIGYKVKI